MMPQVTVMEDCACSCKVMWLQFGITLDKRSAHALYIFSHHSVS